MRSAGGMDGKHFGTGLEGTSGVSGTQQAAPISCIKTLTPAVALALLGHLEMERRVRATSPEIAWTREALPRL